MTVVTEVVPSSGRIREILDSLIVQRQGMRRVAAEPVLLEANRLAIAYWHQQLSRTVAAEQRAAQATPQL